MSSQLREINIPLNTYVTVTFDDGDIPYRSDIIIITLSALEIAFCIILELVPGEGGGGGGGGLII